MTLIQSPETIMLIHRTMVREELERNRLTSTSTRTSPITVIRTFIGGALIAMGQRITPPARTDRTRQAAGRISVAHQA